MLYAGQRECKHFSKASSKPEASFLPFETLLCTTGTEISAQVPAKLPAVVSGNAYLFWEVKLAGEKRQLLSKTLKRNRSEESGEIETFNPRKIIMTEWKIIFVPSCFDFNIGNYFTV